MVMKLALLTAVHEHPLAAVTAAVPVPPSGPNADVLACPTANVHAGVGLAGVVLEHPAKPSAPSTNPEATRMQTFMRQTQYTDSMKTSTP